MAGPKQPSPPPPPDEEERDSAGVLLLAAKDDAYGGVIVDDARLPSDPAEFDARLAASLRRWKARGVRGVWLKLPAALAPLVGPAVGAHGFGYHHAEPAYVMLTRWLPADDGVESGLPPNASHQVGVGALVVDARRGLVLAVQERTGPLRGKNVWKLPTGLVHAGEDLHTAAEREVEEETGVRARFAGVLAVRQAHGFAFGKSDLFFLCALVADDDGGGGGGGGGGVAVADQQQQPKAGGRENDNDDDDGSGLVSPVAAPHPLYGPPQRVVCCEREIERGAWMTLDAYAREQSRFNGHLPLYARLLGRSLRYARAAVDEFASAAASSRAAAADGDGGTDAASAVRAARAAAAKMGMRGDVLDGGIWKPRTDLLLWVDEEGEGEGEAMAGGGGGGAKL
jgi:ADP-ribose pyrophosphatase YjhB (NUDIX family)